MSRGIDIDKQVQVIEVIRTTLELRGTGKQDSAIRRITQYWSLDGELLAEVDPFPAPPASLQKGDGPA